MRTPIVKHVYSYLRASYHRQRTKNRAQQYFLNFEAYDRALKVREEGNVVIQTVDGLNIKIRKNIWDARILQDIFLGTPYTRGIQIPPGATVVDVGGYIGDFSLYAARCLKAGRVIVYEPSRKNFSLLEENLRNNGYAGTITAVNKAVSDSHEMLMAIDVADTKQANVSGYAEATEPCEPVSSVTLEELMEAHQLESVDLLKLDCEGAEYGILRSAPMEILGRIRNIVFEYHEIDGFEQALKEVKAKLAAAGYLLKDGPGSVVSAVRTADASSQRHAA